MEEALEAAILAGVQENEIENLIIRHLLGNEDEGIEGLQEEPHVFNLDEITDEESKANFRFEKEDIYRLVRVLQLPPDIQTDTGNRVSGISALCIVLRRLCYPNRLRDLQPIFGLSPQSLSQIINHTVEFIENTHSHLLQNLANLQWLDREKIQYYAQAIYEKGGAVPNCWGFIDGTARAICRPTVDQQEYYSGHKRFHCLKYQSVLAPDGIIVSLKGAYTGRRHDAGIFRETNLYDELEAVARFDNERYVLYGDQAYGVRELLLAPYPNRVNMPAYQEAFNVSMRNLRVAVEWGFQKIVTEFAFIDFKKNQKLLLQNLEAMYKVAVLLCNCHTCLYSSQSAQYFNVVPPELEEYLGI